jgi:hypothetical protein
VDTKPHNFEIEIWWRVQHPALNPRIKPSTVGSKLNEAKNLRSCQRRNVLVRETRCGFHFQAKHPNARESIFQRVSLHFKNENAKGIPYKHARERRKFSPTTKLHSEKAWE